MVHPSTIFGIRNAPFSAPYDKRPWGAPIISFIFMGNSTILFFFVFFFKIGKQHHLSFDDRLSYEDHLSFDNRLSFELTKKHYSLPFQGVRLPFDERSSLDDRLSFEHGLSFRHLKLPEK